MELEDHYYNATHTGLVELGLKPRLLSEELIETMLHTVERHRDRVIMRAIEPRVRWRPEGDVAADAVLAAEALVDGPACAPAVAPMARD